MVDGDMLLEGVGRYGGKPLNAGGTVSGASPPADRRVAAEVRRVHNQRIALPPTNRVAQPQMDVLGQVRTVLELNHSRVVPHLHVDSYGSWRLHDLIVVVVARTKHW